MQTMCRTHQQCGLCLLLIVCVIWPSISIIKKNMAYEFICLLILCSLDYTVSNYRMNNSIQFFILTCWLNSYKSLLQCQHKKIKYIHSTENSKKVGTGSRGIWTDLEGFATHGDRPLSGTKPPSRYTQVIFPSPTPNQSYLTRGALPASSFPSMLAASGPGDQRLLLQGFAPRATSLLHCSPGLDIPVLPPSWFQH
jgi:hypothetical protein